MRDSVMYFLTPVDFLHAREQDLDGQKFGRLVADVKWCVEHNVPENRKVIFKL
jgi:hypothetical protein